MEEQILKMILEYEMIRPGDRVVVGVSGGADSVCLLRVLLALRERLSLATDDLQVVHVNHGLREHTADRDEAFVRKLCEDLQVPLTVERPDVSGYAKSEGLSVEEAARILRYRALRETLAKLGGGKIAVAHNAGDQAETVLFHLARGSGIAGMAGIRPVHKDVIRPLLRTPRSEIEAYLAKLGQDFCEDETNQDLTYSRNRIRHHVLPELTLVNRGTAEHINSFAEEAAEIEAYFKETTRGLFESVVADEEDDWICLSVAELMKQTPYMRRRLLYTAIERICGGRKDITRVHVSSLMTLLGGETGRSIHLPYDVRARRSYDTLWIEKERPVDEESEEPETYLHMFAPGETVSVPGGRITSALKKRSEITEIPKNIYTKVFDYAKIKDGLCVRTPRESDAVDIDTTGKTKSLSRIMIDAKVDRTLRGTWPIIADATSVLWVIGLRYNESFRLDTSTEDVLYLEYRPEGEDDGREDQRAD